MEKKLHDASRGNKSIHLKIFKCEINAYSYLAKCTICRKYLFSFLRKPYQITKKKLFKSIRWLLDLHRKLILISHIQALNRVHIGFLNKKI